MTKATVTVIATKELAGNLPSAIVSMDADSDLPPAERDTLGRVCERKGGRCLSVTVEAPAEVPSEDTTSSDRVVLVGRIADLPENLRSASGDAVCQFQLTAIERLRGRLIAGDDQQHRVVVRGPTAQLVGIRLKPGQRLLVDGRCLPGNKDMAPEDRDASTEIEALHVILVGEIQRSGYTLLDDLKRKFG